MITFKINFRNGKAKVYRVDFMPWPKLANVRALAKSLLDTNGGYSVNYDGCGFHGLER